MMNKIVIGSRGSPLAVVQSEKIRSELIRKNEGFEISLKIIKTTGDLKPNADLGSLNLKGAFTKELDEALFRKEIDVAVHSLKDLPSEIPQGLSYFPHALREDCRDALISKDGKKLASLPPGSKIGTSSLRRQSQLLKNRPDLKVVTLRGNVDTRLRKLEKGECDALLLAAAGLRRLGKEKLITEYLDPSQFIPAVGQGVLGLVCRSEDSDNAKRLMVLSSSELIEVIKAEREFMRRMEGGCSIPLGIYSQLKGASLHLKGYLGSTDGKTVIEKSVEGTLDQAETLGKNLAEEIKAEGGAELLIALRRG